MQVTDKNLVRHLGSGKNITARMFAVVQSRYFIVRV